MSPLPLTNSCLILPNELINNPFTYNGMSKHLLSIASILLLTYTACLACTSAIVSGRLTANGRPLMWKHRDTGEQNNRIERVKAHDGLFEFVALFDARDSKDSAAWIGFNERGFAIMNTASYNLKDDNVPDSQMDREGVVMRYALERCATVADFERVLEQLPKPLGVEANFGVMDADGNAAYFETNNYKWTKFDLADEPSGILIRTNYSVSGRKDEGMGYIRFENATELLRPHIVAADITPATFTEELSRTFYNSKLNRNYNKSYPQWIVDQDYIPRSSSTASIVIEGIAVGEPANLTVMWSALGYPPCAEVVPCFLGEGGVPQELTGSLPNRHSIQSDRVLARKAEVFPVKRGNGKRYINFSKLYNHSKTGYCQVLSQKNAETYRTGYAEIERRRARLNKRK